MSKKATTTNKPDNTAQPSTSFAGLVRSNVIAPQPVIVSQPAVVQSEPNVLPESVSEPPPPVSSSPVPVVAATSSSSIQPRDDAEIEIIKQEVMDIDEHAEEGRQSEYNLKLLGDCRAYSP